MFRIGRGAAGGLEAGRGGWVSGWFRRCFGDGLRFGLRFGFRFWQRGLADYRDCLFIPGHTVAGGQHVARVHGFAKERFALEGTFIRNGHERQRAEPVINGKTFRLGQGFDRHGGNADIAARHGPVIGQFRDVIWRRAIQRAAHLRL